MKISVKLKPSFKVKSALLITGILFLLTGIIPALATDVINKEKKTITLWTSGDPNTLAAVQKTCDDFEKLNPDIKVKVTFISGQSRTQKYIISMQAGKAADIIMFHWTQIPLFAPKNCLLPLDDFIRGDQYNLSDYFQQGLSVYKYNNVQYCLPVNGSTVVLFYNKNLFDQAGLKYPDNNWTIDDMIQAGQRLKELKDKDGRNIIGCLPYDISSWIWSMGAEFADDEMTKVQFNSEKMIEAVKIFWGLRYTWNITSNNINVRGQDTTSLDVFEAGNVGMYVNGPWMLPKYTNINNFSWDIALFPRGAGGRQTRYAGMGYGIWAKTKHPAESWKLLKFLQNPEQMSKRSGEFTDIPSRKSVANGIWAEQNANCNVQILLKSISGEGNDTIRAFPKNELWSNVYRYFQDSVDMALLNKLSVEEAMNKAQSKTENYLSKKRYEPGLFDYLVISGLVICAVISVVFMWKRKNSKK